MQVKQAASIHRCPYYKLAEGGVYGSLANISDWSTQYWGALADSTLLGAGCPVAQSSLPAKYQACPTAKRDNVLKYPWAYHGHQTCGVEHKLASVVKDIARMASGTPRSSWRVVGVKNLITLGL